MGISVYPPASGGITTRTLKQEVFNTSGTWTYPSSSKFDGTVFVTAVGGGGAGGSARAGSGSGPWMWTGGGGGGRVILDKEINVLSGGNQTVTVGNGGVSNYNGFGDANGGYTVFGSPVIGNYYPDPNMRRGLINMASGQNYPDMYWTTTNSSYPNYTAPYGTNITSYSGPKTGMDSTEWAILQSGNNYSLYFDVPSSTAMRLHFRYAPTGGSGTITPIVHWYDSTNVYISQTSCTAYTVAATGAAFTLYSDTTSLTSPANAKYAMIRFNGQNGGITDLCISPSSASLTAPVSGNSSGWTWAGSPENSWTVKSSGTNLGNFVIAQGGASGWGTLRVTNGQALMRCNGSAGWSAGGHACVDDGQGSSPSTGDIWFFSGHGGGSDDSAIMPDFFGGYTTSTAVTSEVQIGGTLLYSRYTNRTYSGSANREYIRPFHAGGSGSMSGKFKTAATNQYMLSKFGRPGNSTAGYGAGGTGAWYSVASALDTGYPISGGTSTRTIYRGDGSLQPRDAIEKNTGNGGAGIYASGDEYGQNGSSGLVIVRWYE